MQSQVASKINLYSTGISALPKLVSESHCLTTSTGDLIDCFSAIGSIRIGIVQSFSRRCFSDIFRNFEDLPLSQCFYIVESELGIENSASFWSYEFQCVHDGFLMNLRFVFFL